MKKIVILCIAAVSFAGCTGKKGVTAVAEDKGVLTKSAVAEEASVQLTEVFTSEIEPYKENDITPAASGVHIDRIYVEVGDPVREGQLVVTLDPTQYTQQLVQLKTVEDDYNRLLPVYEAGGISTQQIEQAKAQLDVQREVVANLKKNIEVRSPISGVVTARNYESGDLFAQQPILHIMQIDPLKVIANISEQYFPNVKVGMPVKLAVDIFPDEEFTGTVSLIYPALDPTTRTFKVEVKVPNAKRTLRPGMYARTTFNMGEVDNVTVLDVAIQRQTGTNDKYVYVLKDDGTVESRFVTTGRQVGDRIEVLAGLAEGEKVVIAGSARLLDGMKVQVIEGAQQ